MCHRDAAAKGVDHQAKPGRTAPGVLSIVQNCDMQFRLGRCCRTRLHRRAAPPRIPHSERLLHPRRPLVSRRTRSALEPASSGLRRRRQTEVEGRNYVPREHRRIASASPGSASGPQWQARAPNRGLDPIGPTNPQHWIRVSRATRSE